MIKTQICDPFDYITISLGLSVGTSRSTSCTASWLFQSTCPAPCTQCRKRSLGCFLWGRSPISESLSWPSCLGQAPAATQQPTQDSQDTTQEWKFENDKAKCHLSLLRRKLTGTEPLTAAFVTGTRLLILLWSGESSGMVKPKVSIEPSSL